MPDSNRIIDRYLSEITLRCRRQNRAAIWAVAEKAATQPRSYADQRYAGSLYSRDAEPLVYRAFNQVDLRRPSNIRCVHHDGFADRETEIFTRVIDFARWSGNVVEDQPMAPLTADEEIAVCRKLIRRYGMKIRMGKRSHRWCTPKPTLDHLQHLLATELVRLRNARDGVTRTLEYAQDEADYLEAAE
jgi:hypothetical protein